MGINQVKLQYYDLSTLAKNLKLASIDVIKTSHTDIESHWYLSLGGADLFFWKAKDKIVKHQVSLYGQVIEWNEYDGVKTGFMNDDEAGGDVEAILFDDEINVRVVEQAIDFLSQTTNIEEKVINELISHYRFYSRWQNFKVFVGFKRFFNKLVKKQ